MLGRPSLRRRLILSYLAVVLAVTGAGFITVQILVPQFFQQAVQLRLGPGSDNGGGVTPGNPDAPGRREESPADSTTIPSTGGGMTVPGTPPSTPPVTGSTFGPGDRDRYDTGSGSGNGAPGGDTDPGGYGTGNGNGGNPGEGSPGTTTDALAGPVPGLSASAAEVPALETNPVPVEIQEEYDKALTGALIIATVIGFVIALGLGFLFTRRILGTLNQVKDGAGRLAAGHYGTRIEVPREAELADMAQSVNTLAASLDRTEQSRARLVSDLAHEIRNPLSTIEGYMEGLIDGVLPPSRETYEAVAGEAHRLKKLTRDLSTLSKAQEGAMELSIAEVDLVDVITSVVDTLGPQFELNDVGLRVDADTPLPVSVDAARMAQALTNLLGNALAHTPPGGSVVVSGVAAGGICSVAIVDTGSGIPKGQLETIFERFTRLDRDQPGTGIGLNIARTLVRAQGGEIHVESAGEGRGSTFTITLPAAGQDASREPGNGRGRAVLP